MCCLLLTKNLLHLGITFTVGDLTGTLFDTLNAFCSFWNEKNTEVIAQTHRGVILFCDCAVKPDGLHVVSLGNRPTRPHGPLPISNYYTHTQAALI